MSGLPDHGVPLFDDAALKLKALGFATINPADNDGRSRNKPWKFYMKLDIANVVRSDGVVVLPNWEDSRGATIEVAIAERMEIPIYELEDVLKNGLKNPIQPWVKIESGLQNKDKAAGGTKFDSEKLRFDLIPPSAEEALAEVLTFGAAKYDDDNWTKGFKWRRVYGATRRHLNKWYRGVDNDAESSLNHLKHAFCNIAFLIEFIETHPDLDDRPFKVKHDQN